MLECSCGWQGVNLIPNTVNDTAECPACHAVFAGIKAKDAVIVSGAEEKEVLK